MVFLKKEYYKKVKVEIHLLICRDYQFLLELRASHKGKIREIKTRGKRNGTLSKVRGQKLNR
jgi:hypothetical protein